MKLSKNSWHYKLCKWWKGGNNPSDNLCNYFWSLVLAILLLLVGAGIILVVAFVLIFSMINMFFDPKGLVPGIVSWLTLLIIIIGYFLSRRKPIYREKRPTIIGEWVKAKKGKYCPKIYWI